MKVKTTEIAFSTKEKIEFIDLTDYIQKFVRNSEIAEGYCLIYTKHATAALICNECEEGFKKDLLDLFERLLPKNIKYEHNKIDNNATAHLFATLLKPSLVIPIEKGILNVGTWQRILFLELDGPRGVRKVMVKAMGE